MPQAILFRSGKAIGRLVTPEQRTELLGSSPAAVEHVPAAPASGAQPAIAGTARDSPTEPSQALSRPQLSAGTPLQMVQLSFGHWRPASRGKAADGPGSLRIPVDSAFQSSDFRIQVCALFHGGLVARAFATRERQVLFGSLQSGEGYRSLPYHLLLRKG